MVVVIGESGGSTETNTNTNTMMCNLATPHRGVSVFLGIAVVFAKV